MLEVSYDSIFIYEIDYTRASKENERDYPYISSR